MNVEQEVKDCVEMLITEVEKKAKNTRRVSFCHTTKEGDGITDPRDRVLSDWFKTNTKTQWRSSTFDYESLSKEELRGLKLDTENLFYRVYHSESQAVPLLHNGAGSFIVTSDYLVQYMSLEIMYLHNNF